MMIINVHCSLDADSSLRDPCGYDEWIHVDYRSPVKKRNGSATLSVKERASTLAWTGFYCFSGHITSRMVLIYYVQILIENKGEDVANYIKKKDICKCKGKSGWTGYTHPWEV